MKKSCFLCCLWLMLLASCSKAMDGMDTETGVKDITLSVINYQQYGFDEITRAGADVLDHLSMAIFNATTGEVVGTLTTQNKGEEGYGTFRTTLPYGSYQLVIVGYNGTKLCNTLTPSKVAFEDAAVPMTFYCNKLLTVSDETPTTQPITINRAVTAFVLNIKDAVPANVASFHFVAMSGGCSFNPQTGFTEETAGRVHTLVVPGSIIGEKNVNFTSYLFLPSEEANVTYEVTALDANGDVVRQRTFTDAPLKVNRR
ncbi:MAG: hypothetical protein HUK03_10750, partial [Bacteroidaceae bacterium]|nr:hypothetical protein [Bacteroidaceae bacterium]